ncbi:hypothetical protein C0993_008842 [Termitomyces sp. T159_Od127]|nr:hypothetical protein C0993_008842 [Termitomyces sp. T159_Od127]
MNRRVAAPEDIAEVRTMRSDVTSDRFGGSTSFATTTSMESLNLHTLASSLPTAPHNTEELTNNFRGPPLSFLSSHTLTFFPAAALSITTLYKSSRKTSKRAYTAGYAAACQDLLSMIQQGVSASSHGPNPGGSEGGLTIGRVMDWTEARLEAIKAREEEEDEEEEREREKDAGKSRTPAPPPPKPVKPSTARSKTQVRRAHIDKQIADSLQPLSLPTPNSPRSSQPQPSEPSSPSPPPPSTLRPIQRPLRPRAPLAIGKADLIPGTADSGASFPLSSDIPIPIAAGAKRRHAMMMMLDAAAAAPSIDGSTVLHPHPQQTGQGAISPGGVAGSSRRRTRSSRHQHPHQHPHQHQQNQNVGPNLHAAAGVNGNGNASAGQAGQDAMDVEEDGRERKRVARR